jgi:hypothetical protein
LSNSNSLALAPQPWLPELPTIPQILPQLAPRFFSKSKKVERSLLHGKSQIFAFRWRQTHSSGRSLQWAEIEVESDSLQDALRQVEDKLHASHGSYARAGEYTPVELDHCVRVSSRGRKDRDFILDSLTRIGSSLYIVMMNERWPPGAFPH